MRSFETGNAEGDWRGEEKGTIATCGEWTNIETSDCVLRISHGGGTEKAWGAFEEGRKKRGVGGKRPPLPFPDVGSVLLK